MEDILFLFHVRIRMGAAIVPVGIRQRVVEIQGKRTASRTVVAVATHMRHVVLHAPIF